MFHIEYFYEKYGMRCISLDRPIPCWILTFDIIVHSSNNLKIIHDILEYLNAFISKNIPQTDNDRVKNKVTLNLTGYFLLK